MSKPRIIVIMGSKSDLSFARKIGEFLKQKGFSLRCEYNVSSAHKTPYYLLEKLEQLEESKDDIVYITVAGLSDALSGLVSAFTKYPVVACPPDLEKWGFMKAFSSIATPTGVPVLLAVKPENAALAAVKILSLSKPSLQKKLAEYSENLKEQTRLSDKEIPK